MDRFESNRTELQSQLVRKSKESMMMKKMIATAVIATLMSGFMMHGAMQDKMEMSHHYTMEAQVIESNGEEVSVVLENGHVYSFNRVGLNAGGHIKVTMHDNYTGGDVTDDYPLM